MRGSTPTLHARCLWILLGVMCTFAALPAIAQPALDSLWPYEDGKNWAYVGFEDVLDMPREEFTGRLIFEGTGTFPPGVEVRNLIGQVNGVPVAKQGGAPRDWSPFLRRLWEARPELRASIEARAIQGKISYWPALLLAPANLSAEVGHRESSDRIGVWRETLADWSWWYLTDDLFAGAQFTLQLVPDLADDVFLHGTVRGTEEGISTGAGDWTNATICDYVVDYGTGELTDVNGGVIGTVESETTGWVAFVPDVGPVASSEIFRLMSVDCPLGCEEEGLVGQVLSRVELSLRELPVPVEPSTWGALKSGW